MNAQPRNDSSGAMVTEGKLTYRRAHSWRVISKLTVGLGYQTRRAKLKVKQGPERSHPIMVPLDAPGST